MSFCISKDYNLQKSTLQFLYDKNPGEEPTKITETFGGILSNLNYAWLVRKSKVVVVNCKNGSRVGSWDFGNTLQDDSVEINKVEEIQRPNGREPHLIISLNCETRGGIICIFDFVGSKVIRAIQIVEHITNVHVIDRGQDLFSLSGPLRNFDGVLAVGTVGGNVYILDICRQLCYEGFNSFEARDELNPCQMQVITSENLLDIENYKKIALCNESHLAIFLNVVHKKKTEHFVLKRPDGTDSVHVNKEEVLISALHYCPQLGSILVGYNFGAYQLWNLMSMELVYTSPVCEEHIPIIKFAIQEPADDPRAFCYVWAVYSTDDIESKILPYLVMFALCYESKEFHENYGLLYENFQYCTVRFQRELGSGNNQSNMKAPIGGKCLRLESLLLKNSNSHSEICVNDGAEDALSLCITAWKSVYENGQFTYMSVFDLNQWYKAQMPNSTTFDDCSSYMITLCISDLTNSMKENEVEVLDVNLHKKTIQQFIGTQRLEEHYYPSSLSFETFCLLEQKIVNIHYQGVQKALLSQLQTSGPLCLIRPSDTYQEIVTLGLTPLFAEFNTNSAVTSLNNQREVILNVALEQQLTSWLCKCASEWANGSFSSAGCSLDLLTSWAFRRAITLKRKCDFLCVPLFDYSDDKLDANTINVLSNCIKQIKNISFVFSYILNKLSQFLTNKDTISEQCKNLQMIELYFDVLQWFFNVGLLPEYTPFGSNPKVQDDKIRAPYPVQELEEYYKKRRTELLLEVKKRFSSKKSILFIDNLIKVEGGGERLGKDWEKDGGDGFYPPRSLQALLRTYLLDGVDICNKHSVIIYLLLDLAVVLDIQYKPVVTHLVKFPAVFKVSPSFIKITHAFWQLDHGEFHSAMEFLLDPMVNQDDLKDWHHKVALKSLLVQEQHNLALLYMTVRKPPVVDDEDVLCALSLFISNNMLDEAFYLEKNFKNYTCSKKIIQHLFAECSNYGRLHSIIYRNLTNEEETQFLKYLDDVHHPEAADLKITYFMQRSHYIEAFKTYQECEEDPMKKGLISRLNLKARDQIVHTYKKFLPTVSYQFIESCTKEPNPTVWKEVSKPDPISVCVHKGKEKTEYKSSLILAALAKAKLTFNESVQNVSLWNATTEEIPFLRTPTLMQTKQRSAVHVIIPQVVIDDEDDEEEYGPSPPKKTRLSFSSPPQRYQTSVESNSSILCTPIIVRKDRSYISPTEKHSKDVTSTPTSILKVRASYQKDFKNISPPNITSGSSDTPARAVEHNTLVSGRKSTRTSIVRFDVPSTSSEERSSSLKIRSPERDSRTPERNESISFENSSRSFSLSLTPKNVSGDTDEIYYSPDSSLNNIEELPKDKSRDEEDVANEKEAHEPTMKISPEKPTVIRKAEVVKLVDYDPSSSSKEETDSSVPGSPRGRRSYKKLSSEVTPVRSSPRLSKSHNWSTTERERGGSDHHTATEEQTPSPSIFASKYRKSLNRQVLESNTLARLASNADSVDKTTQIFEERKRVVVDHEKTETSYTKTEYLDRKYSYTEEITVDSASGENSDKLDFDEEPPRCGSSDTFYQDRSENHRLSADTGSNKEISSDKPSKMVRDRTPLRITRRMSRRLSEERTSSAESSQHLSQDNIEENSSKINYELGDIGKQIEKTPMETSTTIEEDKTVSNIAGGDEKTGLFYTNVEYSDRSYSYTAETTLDSASGENVDKLDDIAGTPHSDSFVEELYRDLRKRYRLSEAADRRKEISSEQHSSTPLRITRRMSRRLSEERTSSSESSQQSSQTKIEGKSSKTSDQIVDMGQQIERTSIKRSIQSIEISSPNSPSPTTSNLLVERTPISENVNSQSSYLKHKMKKSSSFLSTPHIGSVEKIIKLNHMVKCRQPLSRRVLENSALKRLVSSYDTSSNEEEEDNLNKDTEMAEENRQNVEEHSTVSLSDSFLEEIAFGVLPKEKELIEKCKKLVALRNSQDYEHPSDPEKNERVIPETTSIKVEEENPPVAQSGEQSSSSLCIEGKTTGQEFSNNDQSKIEFCLYDDLNDENEQNNLEQVIFEISDDVCNQALLESTRDNETLPELDQSRQENVEPKGEETISEMVYGDLSDEDNEDSEMNDNLNKGIIGELSSTVADSNVETSMASVILISESNTEEYTNECSNSDNIEHRVKSAENTAKENSDEKSEEKEVLEDTRRNKPVKRMTRRSSKQLDDQERVIHNESIPLEQTDDLQKRSDSRREPLLETPKYNVRKRTRSVDIPLHSQVAESHESTSTISGFLRAKRKLRSTSVDIPITVEGDIQKESSLVDKSKKKSSSKEEKGNKKIIKSSKENLVEDYRSSRRLTRRQSNILEQSLDKVDLSAIEFLDKTDLKGTPDPQDQREAETSPSSSTSAPKSNKGRPARRISRASSNASDDSVNSNVSSPRRSRNSVTNVDSPVVTGARRKLRSASTEEKHESKPTGRVKERASDISDDSGESDTSVISTRSRKSNTKSDDSNNSTRRKRKVAAKSILPEIKEENSEGANGSPAQNTRRGRKNVQK